MSRMGMAGAAMGRFAYMIQAKGRGDGSAKARMAGIRAHTGAELDENPQLWSITLSCLADAVRAHNAEASEDDRWMMPSVSDDDGNAIPTRTETALASALSIYAAQYGTHTPAPHTHAHRFGDALRASSPSGDKGMERARQALFSSTTISMLTHRLIALVPRMVTGFDYGLLADDLVRFQNGPKGRTAVIAAWSRQYYRMDTDAASAATDNGTTRGDDSPETDKENNSR